MAYVWRGGKYLKNTGGREEGVALKEAVELAQNTSISLFWKQTAESGEKA